MYLAQKSSVLICLVQPQSPIKDKNWIFFVYLSFKGCIFPKKSLSIGPPSDSPKFATALPLSGASGFQFGPPSLQTLQTRLSESGAERLGGSSPKLRFR